MSNSLYPPTKVLLFNILNVKYPVTVDTLRKICQQHKGEIQRAAIFLKKGLQAFVEFRSVREAICIKNLLHDVDIFPGCCTLMIEFSPTEHVNIRINSDVSFNIDIQDAPEQCVSHNPPQLPPQKHPLSNQPTNISQNAPPQQYEPPKLKAMLECAEGLPGVQDILAKVVAGRSNNGMSQSMQPSPAMPRPLMEVALQGYSSLPPQCNTMQIGQQNYRQQAANYSGQNEVNRMDVSEENRLEQTKEIETEHIELNCDGGEGCVAMVSGITNVKVNCDHLFNLFCCYGNVVKIKMLLKKNKPSSALIQYTDQISTELVIKHLNNLTLFGHLLKVSTSKHSSIQDSTHVATLHDGSPAVMSYAQSPNNRYKSKTGHDLVTQTHPPSKVLHWTHPPSKVLHYFNAPPDCTGENLSLLFGSSSAEIPLSHKVIMTTRHSMKPCLGLLEFSSVSRATEALMLVGHVELCTNQLYSAESLHITSGGESFTFKLAFSKSTAISD